MVDADKTGVEILLHTCSKCGSVYGTLCKSGEHECPICGHIDNLYTYEELLPIRNALLGNAPMN